MREAFDGVPEEHEDDSWTAQLDVDANGGYRKTIDNMLIVLRNDPLLKGKIALDEFAARGVAAGALPWDNRTGQRVWSDNDDAGAQWYLEVRYGLTGKDKVMNALSLCAQGNRFNELVDYLNTLEWDGEPRLDTLLIDYLGAEDNVYTRAVMRKSLAAAVARAMVPGTKYDYMPIFTGPQGIGKSTFLRLLGKKWFSDSLQTFEGKEAAEMLQGTWINEIGELNGMTRSEVNQVKQHLSKTEDIYRVPYGRRTDVYPRRCVFFGTTNDAEFLRDNTGNRRFWPVDLGVVAPKKCIFSELAAEVDQVWAEARVRWEHSRRRIVMTIISKYSRQTVGNALDDLVHFGEELPDLFLDLHDSVLVALERDHEKLEVVGKPWVKAHEVAASALGAGHLPEHLVLVMRGDAPVLEVLQVRGGLGTLDLDQAERPNQAIR